MGGNKSPCDTRDLVRSPEAGHPLTRGSGWGLPGPFLFLGHHELQLEKPGKEWGSTASWEPPGPEPGPHTGRPQAASDLYVNARLSFLRETPSAKLPVNYLLRQRRELCVRQSAISKSRGAHVGIGESDSWQVEVNAESRPLPVAPAQCPR